MQAKTRYVKPRQDKEVSQAYPRQVKSRQVKLEQDQTSHGKKAKPGRAESRQDKTSQEASQVESQIKTR